jgi:hypothetical protein
MPYGPKGKLVTPPFIRPIFIVTVWDAVVLLWKYIISQPLRKEFMKQVAFLEKMRSILVDKILEIGGTSCPFAINFTFSVWRRKIKNYFFRASLRGKFGETKEEKNQEYVNVREASKQRVEMMKSIFSNVKTEKKLTNHCWGQCSESVPLRALHGKKTTRKRGVILYYPDSKPKWTTNTSMFPVSNDNRFDSSGNNPSLFLEMLEDVLNRYHIANFLDIKLLSLKSDDYLQKDNIRLYAMNIALCGFSHIIVIGETYCGLLFLDCYGRIFQWDAMADALVFYGNIFEGVLGKSRGVLWGVSGDGSVWELSGIYAYFACSLS